MEDSQDQEIPMDEFLRERRIPEEKIEYFKREKIDSATILMIDEEELKKLLPKYGDRVAVLNFCKRKNSINKKSLIEQLRAKIENKKLTTVSQKLDFKPRKKKETRKVEIGWLCTDSKTKFLRQVRTKFGGGTRKVSVEGNVKCKDILKTAKELFFPGGKSSKGDLGDFIVELFDYKHNKCDLDLTVYEIYDISALTSLRFYLTTYYNKEEGTQQHSDDDFFIPATITTTDVQYEQPTCSIEENGRPYTRSQRSSGLSNFLEHFNENILDDDYSPTDIFLEAPLEETLYKIPEISTTQIEEVLINEKLVFRRGQIFKQFIESVKNHDVNFSNLNIKIILPNGKPEVAEDFSGVFRDALSEFWTTFYENCTEGTDYKVPIIRHDFGRKEWEAVAKILVGGFRAGFTILPPTG